MQNLLLTIAEFAARTEVCVTIFVGLLILVIVYAKMKNEDEVVVPSQEDISESSKLEKELLSEDDVDLRLDAKDVEMIKKVNDLDTTNPREVKQYVNEIRSQTYRSQLSDNERLKEEEAKQQQLAQIFALMNQEKEKFGETSINDLQEQMSLYSG